MYSRFLQGCCLATLLCAAGVSCAADPAGALDQAAAAERSFAPAQLREDFERMYRGLQAAHIDLYAFTPKRQLDERYARALADLNTPLTRFQAKVKFQLFAAAVRMGHTRVESPASDWRQFRSAGGKGFPLRIRVLDRHVYVTENLSGLEAIRPGDELKSLNGEALTRWLDRTERHVSAETPYMADSLMEYDFPMYLWIELGAVDGFDLEIVRSGAAAQRLRVPALTSAQMEAARARQPLTLNLEQPLRDARMLGERVAYLRLGPFYNADAKTEAEAWDVSGFQQFID